MKRKKYKNTAIALCTLMALAGCGAQASGEASSVPDPSPSQEAAVTTASTIDTSTIFSDRDLEGTYDESAVIAIQLSGDSAACDSDAVTIEGSRITIGAEGVYVLSGTLADGQIVVNAGETDKVQLVLAGADITSSTSAAIYALEADKVFVTLAEGTENTLTNGGAYVAIDDNNIDAVIFAKTDLTLNGSGSLTVNAQAGHGVVSKDDLVITGGSYTITAQGDAVSAQGALQIDGGTFDLYTGEGSASVDMTTSDVSQMGGSRGGMDAQTEVTATATEEDTVSQKGIKGESTYTINGGVFTIDSADDCLHAGGAMTLAAGEFTLSSGDDAVHCDDALTIQSGAFTIPYCYEGIEGLSITIEDGTFDITSSDDGLNAAGGTDSSGFGGFGGQPQDTFTADSDSFITINGGTFTIVSSGDCIDSNGALTINGGTLDLTCNGSGNTTMDCDGTYANNGGNITTNDGSEVNPGQMGGGKGGAQSGGARQDGTNGGGRPDGQTLPATS